MLKSIYNAPVHDDGRFVAITKCNEYLIADVTLAKVTAVARYTQHNQLWPVEWDERLVLRSNSAVYEMKDDFELDEIWSHPTFSLLPMNRVLESEGGTWDNKNIKLSCFDVRTRDLLWALQSDEISVTNTRSGVLLVSGSGRAFQKLLSMESGETLWKFCSPVDRQRLELTHVADSWLILSGIPRSGEGPHFIYKLDIKTGDAIWEAEVPYVGYKYDAVRDQFVGFGAGRLTIIDGASGQIKVDCSLADALERPSGQQSVKIVLDPQVGKLIFDVGSENTVIGCLDYVRHSLDWLSPFADIGTIRVNKLWFNNSLIHIFDSMDTLRVGRNEGDRLQML